MKKLLPTSTTLSVNKSKGFTLVELLVVVAIIAVLSVIGITIFTSVQKGARDAKRKADVGAISKALEAHYNDTTAPCSATVTDPYCASASPSFFSGGALPTNPGPGGADYLIKFPPAPAARTTYTVCALLENNNGNSSTAGDGTTFTSATGAAATYYCTKNQQ